MLRAVRTPTPEDVAHGTVRARYTAGTSRGEPVPDYVHEEGIDPANETETLAQVTLYVENWRWEGVPFVLRSGKALDDDEEHVAIHFREVPHLTFGQRHPPRHNTLLLGLSPDRLELMMEINGSGDFFDLEPVTLSAALAPQLVSAYGRVILDVLHGDPTLSIRGDEAEECWRIVEPILESWKRGVPEMREYPAGSSGPDMGGDP